MRTPLDAAGESNGRWRKKHRAYSRQKKVPVCAEKEKSCRKHCLRQPGGGGWIRTTEVTDNRFTVCPLWPLGNSSILIFSDEAEVELVDGFEPPTC